MAKLTETELRLEYSDRTWDIDLPDCLDDVIEDDYVKYSQFYSEEVINIIPVLYLLFYYAEPEAILEQIHNYFPDTTEIEE